MSINILVTGQDSRDTKKIISSSDFKELRINISVVKTGDAF